MENSICKIAYEIKDYFVKNSFNDFIINLNQYGKVDSIDVFGDDKEDMSVIISFKESYKNPQCIYFDETCAVIDFSIGDAILSLPLYYTKITKDIKKGAKFGMHDGIIGQLCNYDNLGKDKLFDDILYIAQAVSDRKMKLEYIPSTKKPHFFKKMQDKLLKKSIISFAECDEDKEDYSMRADEIISTLSENRVYARVSRIISNDELVVGKSCKWRDKYLKNPKLRTIVL